MDIAKEFSDLTGITLENLTSGSKDVSLVIPRGIYLKLRVFGHGETRIDAGREINLSYGRAKYALIVAENAISSGCKKATHLWKMVEHLTLEYLYHKSYDLSDDEHYYSLTKSKMRRLMDLVCKEYDENYINYSYSEKAIMRIKAEKWFIAILKTV